MPRPPHQPLRSGEMAAAAAMAAVGVGLIVIGSIVPHAGPVQVFTVVPFGIVADRHRPGVLVASIVAGGSVATLITGLGGGLAVGVFALLGGFVGGLKRRGRGTGTVALAAVVLGPLAAAFAVGLLTVIASSRDLVLGNLKSTVTGVGSALRHLGPLRPVGVWINAAAATVIGHWQVTVAVVVLVIVPVLLNASWVLISEVLDRLRWVGAGTDLSAVAATPLAPGEQPAPVPVELRCVSVSYDATEALREVDLDVPVGQFIAVVGDNGSGKSTLARILAGAEPTSGSVARAGPVGLGRAGGTAMIVQRPDAQVVGLRVSDDVVWGLPEDHGVDIEGLLRTVGLAGMASHETATLSGGQLQRLAVAAALARRPRLLISDESTAMIDPAGREDLVRLLAELPRRWPMTVVHITHNLSEVGPANRIIRLAHGRLVEDVDSTVPSTSPGRLEPVSESRRRRPSGAVPAVPESPLNHATSGATRAASLVLNGVGYVYGYGTIWERRALQDVSLSIEDGEGLLFAGDNGSGKSTLAWIVAGLLRPTDGACLLDGIPTQRRRASIGIAFQHARLQLQRPTVGADIADAAGWLREADQADASGHLDARIPGALRAVGLDPELSTRSIEQLSGGQQRRVAIAGLLARGTRVLVLDEPLAGLDAPTRSGLADLLAELRNRVGLTVIVVTHDPEPLAAVCPRMLRLDHGRIIEDTGRAVGASLESTAA